MLTQRIQNLSPSPTFAIESKVRALKQKGIPVINLGLGEPDFDTPVHIRQAGIQAIQKGFTHYTQTAGILELRESIVKKLKADNNIEYNPSQVVVGSGSKAVLYTAFMILLEKGDEIIVPTPTWSSYVEQIKLTQATPILLPLKAPFKLTAADVEKKLTRKTKAILLNTPSNPTGAMIEKEELEKIASLAVKHNIWVITDEMYEKIIYSATHISIASLGKEIQKRTITINGFSKTYAMTGWRLGYVAGPQEVITAMSDLQSQLTANASSIAQHAGVAALLGDKTPIKKMIGEFTERRAFLLKELSKIPGLGITPPEGSFYFFIDITKCLNKKYPTAVDFAEGLLQKKHVAVVPGEAFFAPGYMRISFASQISTLASAVQKIKEFII